MHKSQFRFDIIKMPANMYTTIENLTNALLLPKKN